MHRLIPLDAAGTPDFVTALQRAWDDGDAVVPVDPRLPRPAVARFLAALDVDAPVEPGDGLVVPTSGTTGEPKGVVLTHDAVAAAAWATSARLGVEPDHDVWLACLPLAHVGGLSVVTRALLTGTPLVVHPGFDPAAASAAARGPEPGSGRPVTLVSLVPTALGRLDPSVFRAVLLGGSAPPNHLPDNVVTTYGMTETGGGVVYDGIPLDGVQVRVEPGTGELSLRGPMLMRCYRDGTDSRDAEGWLPTGDLGTVDPATGRVAVDGRAGDLIITGGENVWPSAVEAVLGAHPQVAEVAVVGRPDPEWGQRVVAVVVPVPGGGAPPLADLRALVKGHLGPWAAPKDVEVVDDLPRTALGKIRRSHL
jgi:O-succinylbenzoic acid--CoA ligase